MRCEYCGGDISLKDEECPYCGAPVQNVMQHKKAMDAYNEEFVRTKQKVFEETEKTKKFSARLVVIAALVIVNVILILLTFNGYELSTMFQKASMSKELSTYRTDLDRMLEEGQYGSLAEYVSTNELYLLDSLDEYDCVIDLSGYYNQLMYNISDMLTEQTDGENEEDLTGMYERVATTIASYEESISYDYYFEEDRLPEKYKPYAEDIQERIKMMVITYCNVTEEDWESFAMMSDSGIEKTLEERAQGNAAKDFK